MIKDDKKNEIQLPHQHREMVEGRKRARHLELRNAIEHAFQRCNSMDGLLAMVNQFVDGAEAADLGIGPKGIAVFVNHSNVPVSLHTRTEAFTGIFGSTQMPGVQARTSSSDEQQQRSSYSAAFDTPRGERSEDIEPANGLCSPANGLSSPANGLSSPIGSPTAAPLLNMGGERESPPQNNGTNTKTRSRPPSLSYEGASLHASAPPLSPVEPDPLSPTSNYPSLSPSQVPLTHVPLAFRMPHASNSTPIDPKNVCIVYRLGTDVAKSVLPRVKLSMMEITPEAMEVAPGFRVTTLPQSLDAPIYEIFSSEDLECTVRTYEYQRWYPVKGWSSNLLPTDRATWSDKTGSLARPREFYVLPKSGKWKWVNDWTLTENTGDIDHWTYAVDMPSTYGPKTKTSFVRRRMWTRTMSKRIN